MKASTKVSITMAACLAATNAANSALAEVVLYNGKAVEIAAPLSDPTDLWVTAEDLTRINGMELKPEGAVCLDDLCVLLKKDGDEALLVNRDGKDWINLSALAGKLQQGFAVDREAGVWSFAPVPATREPFLKSAIAPDFELVDRQGKTVKLSDFRGKKVLLVTWASWCGCRLDVAKWEPLYQKLKSRGFEIISVAEDTGGEAVAGPIFDAAKVSFVTIVDPEHKVSALYNFVNVPSAAWIDEEGHVVRINEGTYASKHKIGAMEIGTNDYAPAVEDWVINGAASKYVWSPEKVAERIRPLTSDEAKAEATFALGVHFFNQMNLEKAKLHWDEAAVLYPDSWNINRQDWAITDKASQNRNWMKKVGQLKKPYYAPLELEK